VSTTELSPEEVQSRLAEVDLDDWLGLWHASQGGEPRGRRLAQMAALLPLDPRVPARVLDLFSGPGDVGRAVRERFPLATIDCVDGDPVLLGLCRALNLRAGVPGRIVLRDAWQRDWLRGLDPGYDAICAVAALHWFDRDRFSELLCDLHDLLRPGGFLMLNEPTSTLPAFASGLALWERENGESWDPVAWEAFLERARVEFEHAPEQPESSPGGRPVIGDEGMPVREYLERLQAAGFASCDVVARSGWVATFIAQRV
jgi:SAM-dependent methyltransferase